MVQLLPGGAYEVSGINPGWRTYTKYIDQEVEVEDRNPVTVKAGSYLRIFRQYDGRTYSSGEGPAIEDCSDEITEIDAPVAPGETVYFEWCIYLTGSPNQNYAVCVHTPTNPSGGFQVIGRSVMARYMGGAFGADDFNSPAGVFKGGLSGSLASYATVRVRGVLGNGYQPGRLVLQLAPAEEPAGAAGWYVFAFNFADTPYSIANRSRLLVSAETSYFSTGPVRTLDLQGTDVTITPLGAFSKDDGGTGFFPAPPNASTITLTSFWFVVGNSDSAEIHVLAGNLASGWAVGALWSDPDAVIASPSTQVANQDMVDAGPTVSVSLAGHADPDDLVLALPEGAGIGHGRTDDVLGAYRTFGPIAGQDPPPVYYQIGPVAAFEVEGFLPPGASGSLRGAIYAAAARITAP